MGMCNSLYCFMDILCSTIQTRVALLFLLSSFFNFVNLYLIILKVLHNIGLVNYLSINADDPIGARRFITKMHVKIYITILLGLIFGMQNFPNQYLILSIPLFFYAQLFTIASKNNRIFPCLKLNFCLTLSKLVYCIFSKNTIFGAYRTANDRLAFYSASFLMVFGFLIMVL